MTDGVESRMLRDIMARTMTRPMDPPAPDGYEVHEGTSSKCHPCVSKNFAQCQQLGPCSAPDRPDGRWVYFTRAVPTSPPS